MEIITFVENATRILHIVMFLTGIPPCILMYRSKKTVGVPYILFLLNAVCTSTMLHYGLLINNSTLIFLNSIGTILTWSYVLVYLLIARPKGQSVVRFITTLLYMTLVYIYVSNAFNSSKEQADGLGKSAMFITVITLLLRTQDIINNFRYKNCEGMPFIMTLGALACQLCWFWYGLLLNDVYIYTLNIPGIILGFLRFYTATVYGSTNKPQKRD